MIEQLLAWDKSLFLLINSFNSEFFDDFFWIITQKETWIPLYASLLYLIIKTKKQESVWILLGLLLSILLADQLASSVIKPLVGRLRPSHDASLASVIHIVSGYTGGKFGFVSSHAANSFGLAMFSSLLFRKKTFTVAIFYWAILNSYSRIYLGVHFPADIICGAAIGVISALLMYLLIKKYRPISFKTGTYRPKSSKYFWNSEKLIVWVLVLSFLIITILSIVEITSL